MPKQPKPPNRPTELSAGKLREAMGGKKTIIIRVAEWTHWLPTHIDPKVSGLPFGITNGVSGLEVFENEKLISIMPSSTEMHMEIETGANGKKELHTLYAFQATLAMEMPEGTPVPRGPAETYEVPRRSALITANAGSPIMKQPGSKQ